jgi:hypothetical protein
MSASVSEILSAEYRQAIGSYPYPDPHSSTIIAVTELSEGAQRIAKRLAKLDWERRQLETALALEAPHVEVAFVAKGCNTTPRMEVRLLGTSPQSAHLRHVANAARQQLEIAYRDICTGIIGLRGVALRVQVEQGVAKLRSLAKQKG